ncbi:site-specific integrase [Butyrivibrio sp. CB08]|uniref:tyrosine-type recombinase/integrase n=1 Tax=Butyrivibrio sp. CB08 TaxID=2364879 RepID=UPI000EA9F9DC|nr:site-specific integrase [Butyrivibrio sp. CB08]RKM60494.1 site-specific integrase [Butyrivibrio sp. CB08]
MARRTKRADGLLQKKFRIKVKGVSKQFIVYGHSEKELTEKEQAKREEVERGLEKQDNPTVSEYYERWMSYRKDKVSEATIRTQDKFFGVMSKIKMQGLAGVCFGELKIKDVDIEILIALQAELKTGRKSQTVNDYMALLKHIFSDAYKARLIEYNPCLQLQNLKRTEERARDTHHRALSIEETKAFFSCERCKNSYYYNVFRMAINTGMRIGEIGALKNSDIHNGTIHIERTITRTESGAYIIGDDAKTEAGKRIIPMNEQIKTIITEQKELDRLINGNVVSMDNQLFKAVEGGLLMATPIDREIKRICKDAGIEPFTMHAFRATFATRAIESGMNPKTLQEILGHSNFNITMSLYGHCLENTKKQEMDAINIAI